MHITAPNARRVFGAREAGAAQDHHEPHGNANSGGRIESHRRREVQPSNLVPLSGEMRPTMPMTMVKRATSNAAILIPFIRATRRFPRCSTRDPQPAWRLDARSTFSSFSLGKSQLQPRRSRFAEAARSLEQLVPSLHLRVLGVLELHPTRTAAVRLVRAVRPLAHNALEIKCARSPSSLACASERAYASLVALS